MGNRLGAIMRERGLTYQGLATGIKRMRGRELSEATICSIVKYGDWPKLETQQAIADYLGLKVEDIWWADDEYWD